MFLGLDLSLCSTGVVLLDNDGKIKRKYIILSENKGDDVINRMDRYTMIVSELKSIIYQYNDCIKNIAIESYSLYSKGQRLVQMIESGTLVRYFLYSNICKVYNSEIIEVSPMSVKKYILGTVKNRNAKNVMCREVYKKYKIDLDDDNIVDAFLLANIAKCYYERKNNIESDYYKYQYEVVDNILKKNKKK
jgi:hypothetical protein